MQFNFQKKKELRLFILYVSYTTIKCFKLFLFNVYYILQSDTYILFLFSKRHFINFRYACHTALNSTSF